MCQHSFTALPFRIYRRDDRSSRLSTVCYSCCLCFVFCLHRYAHIFSFYCLYFVFVLPLSLNVSIVIIHTHIHTNTMLVAFVVVIINNDNKVVRCLQINKQTQMLWYAIQFELFMRPIIPTAK